MLGHTNTLYILTYFVLILLWPVNSYASNTQVSPSIGASKYKVDCDPQALSAANAFKLQCRDLIRKRVIGGPGPFSGTTKWEEEIWTSTNSIWTTSSPLCAISFTGGRPLSPQTWTAVKEGIEAIAHECVDKKGLGGVRTKVATRRQIENESPVMWITIPYHSSQAIPTPSPPENPKHTPPGTCWQLLSSSPQTLTEPEKRIRTGCYQLIGATGALAAGLYTGISNPLLSGGFAFGGMVLAHQATGNLDAGLQRSGPRDKRRRSQEGERMLGLPASSHSSQSIPQSSPLLPISHTPPSSPPSLPPSSPPSSRPSSPRAGSIGRFEMSSPPTEAETRRVCTLLQCLGPRLGRTREELIRRLAVTPEQKKLLRRFCCKYVGAICVVGTGGVISQFTGEKAVAPLYVAGILVGLSGTKDLYRATQEEHAPHGTDVIVKRRRSMDGEALEGLVNSPSSPAPSSSPRRERPMSSVKRRRSQEGARMVGLSSPPGSHRPPSPPTQPSPSSPPSPSSSSQARPSHLFETSSPPRQAELRRICNQFERLSEEERHKMRQICCKMLAGGCLLTAGGGIIALTNTFAGIPFAVAGAGLSISSFKNLHDSSILRPPSPRGPANPANPRSPVKRRRGLVRRRAEDKTMKPEDRRKALEVGGDLDHSGGESDEGIEMEGGDDGGGGDGGD